MLQDAVKQCSVIAIIADGYDASGGCDAMTHDDTKKDAKLPNNNSDDDDDTPSAAAAPTSFSLFDMLDAQKGGFNLPPRVMAYQIIETYEHEKKQRKSSSSTNNTQTTQIDDKLSTTTTLLELFEKATDIEDLSTPDLNSWEEVRKILYRGLLISTSNDDDSSSAITNAIRYVKVHQTLHDKCCHTNNNDSSVQSWDLVYNIIGSLLHIQQQSSLSSSLDNDVIAEGTMNLYWDTTRTLLHMLSKMAMNYVTSSVGNEYEIERLLLGLCMLLANNDDVACILSIMEPMCGYFEVWSRFVMDRKKFMRIVQLSGLGSVVLQRCQDALGGYDNDATMRGVRSRRVWNKIVQSATNNEKSSDGGVGKPTTGDDIRYCTFLQSLSILRTIMFRCNGSSSEEIMAMFLPRDHQHHTTTIKPSSFLTSDGVISTEAVQTLLSKTTATADNENKCLEQQQHSNDDDSDDIKAVMKSFCNDLLKKMKDDSTRISNDNNNDDLNLLCTQIVHLAERIRKGEADELTSYY